MPAMYNCDFPGIDFLHAGLVRPRTVSNGDGRCGNWYVSADSDAVRKYSTGKRPSDQQGLEIKKNDIVKQEVERCYRKRYGLGLSALC